MDLPKISKAFIKRVKKDKSSKLKRMLYVSVLVFLAVLFARGDYGLLKIYRLQSRIDEAEKEITRLKVQTEDLNWEIKKLESDTTYQKLYAADKFNYAKAGQVIIQFLPNPESQDTSTAPAK